MAKVIFRQKAIDDINDIWNYTFDKWSERQADNYYTIIKMACKAIGENPNIGKKYHSIKGNLLGFKSGKHIIFYEQKSNNIIEIIRILHERMDLKSRIME